MSPTTPEAQIERELAVYEQDLAWILENYGSLVKQHGDEFLAVLEGKVIGHAARIEDLCNELKSKQGEDFHRVAIEFIYKEHPNFVLGYDGLL